MKKRVSQVFQKKKELSKKEPSRIYVNTSMRWNAIWSHSHELTRLLAKKHKITYYEPPGLTVPRSTVLFEKNNFERPSGVEFIGSKKKFAGLSVSYMLSYQRDTAKEFRKHKNDFDVFLTYNVYELANLYRAKRWGKRVVFIFADEYDELTTLPLLKPFLRFSLIEFLKKSDVVVCTAKAMADRARRYNKNVVYLPNAVNLEDKKFAAMPKREAHKLGRGKPFTIGFVGAVEPWVDHEILVDAALLLAKSDPALKFEIVGDGTTMLAFKEYAQKKNVQSIAFLGYKPHSEVYAAIARWDAAVIPFKINTITNSVSPVKLFEYWLLKTPVLTTKTIELSQYADALLLFDTPEALVRNVHKLMDQPTLGKTLGERGNTIVHKQCNWQAYAPAYFAIVEGKPYEHLVPRGLSRKKS